MNQYLTYLKSPKWQQVRKKYFNSKLFNDCCFCCGEKKNNYHLHHKSYKTFGNENLNHLVAVCSKCHEFITKLVKSNKFKLSNWGAARRLKKILNGENTKIAKKQREFLGIKK